MGTPAAYRRGLYSSAAWDENVDHNGQRGREFAFECVLLLRRSLRPHQDAEKMRLCCVAYCMMRQFSPQFAIVFFAQSRVPCDAAIRPSIRGM